MNVGINEKKIINEEVAQRLVILTTYCQIIEPDTYKFIIN